MSVLAELRARLPRIQRQWHRQALLRRLPGPPGHPIFGHLRQVPRRDMVPALTAWARRYGPVYRYRLLHRTLVVLCDTALIRQALRQRPQRYRRISLVESILGELDVGGVFAAEGEDWRRQRRLVMSAFGRSKLADMHQRVVTVTDRLLEQWERSRGQPRDVRGDLMRFTADVTTLVAFGYDLDSLRTPAGLQQKVTLIFDELARRLFAPVPYWRVYKRPRDRALDEAIASVRQTVRSILHEGDASGPDNLLRRLQQARLEEGSRRGLSEGELFSNVMALLFAGEDTTANTLAWLVHFLAANPGVQAKVQAEADAVLGERHIADSPALAQALTYTAAAFAETLRLRPVAPMLLLETNEEVELGSFRIPAGVPLACLLDHDNRDPACFPQPEAFRPERWLADQRPGDTLAFGGGSRICPGRALAQLEVQVLVSALVRRYEVSLVPGAPSPQTIASFTYGPDQVRVRITRRSEHRQDPGSAA